MQAGPPQLTSQTLLAYIDAIIDDAQNLQPLLDPVSVQQQVAQHIRRSQQTVGQLITCNKRYYEQLCELHRNQIKSVPQEPLFFKANSDSLAQLDKLIVEHLLRSGNEMQRVSSSLIKEGNIQNIDPQHILDLNKIVNALENNDCAPALKWAKKQKHMFELRKFEYLELLKRAVMIWQSLINNQMCQYAQSDFEKACQACLQYARDHLGSFICNYQDEVLELMGALSFVQQIAFDMKQAPYANLFDPKLKQTLISLTIKEYCTHYNFAEVSPLAHLQEASEIAIPLLKPIRKLLKPDMQELMIDVDLPSHLRPHNIFVCPVNKEPCTQDNLPQLLTCGHVVSRQALERMARTERQKFKCYTCPAQMLREEVKEIII